MIGRLATISLTALLYAAPALAKYDTNLTRLSPEPIRLEQKTEAPAPRLILDRIRTEGFIDPISAKIAHPQKKMRLASEEYNRKEPGAAPQSPTPPIEEVRRIIERPELDLKRALSGDERISISLNIKANELYEAEKTRIRVKNGEAKLQYSDNRQQSRRELMIEVPAGPVDIGVRLNNREEKAVSASIGVIKGVRLRTGYLGGSVTKGVSVSHYGKNHYAQAILDHSEGDTTQSTYMMLYANTTSSKILPDSFCLERSSYSFAGYPWRSTTINVSKYLSGKMLRSVYAYYADILNGTYRTTNFQAGIELRPPGTENLKVKIGADDWRGKVNPSISLSYILPF
ncbi:hypothetical protein JW826_04280 [Candidatus Woesearchaeota archaeon]|nr:hypothetical protein [Candidatus Woesearchaeota archaeon]